jgi:hypothetical protein
MVSDDIQSSLSSLRQKSHIYAKTLDSVSLEIKRLEKELQDYNICVDASVILSEDSLNSFEKTHYFQKNVSGWQILRTYSEEVLRWKKDPNTGKYRIFYTREVKEDRENLVEFSTNTFSCKEFPDGLSEQKPLIECSVDIRVKAIPRLTYFVREIEKAMDDFVSQVRTIKGANHE